MHSVTRAYIFKYKDVPSFFLLPSFSLSSTHFHKGSTLNALSCCCTVCCYSEREEMGGQALEWGDKRRCPALPSKDKCPLSHVHLSVCLTVCLSSCCYLKSFPFLHIFTTLRFALLKLLKKWSYNITEKWCRLWYKHQIWHNYLISCLKN